MASGSHCAERPYPSPRPQREMGQSQDPVRRGDGWGWARSPAAKWRSVPKTGPGAKANAKGSGDHCESHEGESGVPMGNPDKPHLSQVRAKPGEGQEARAGLRLTQGLICVCLKVAVVMGSI